MKILTISLIIMFLGIGVASYPFLCWFQNDSMTAMQVFKSHWIWMLGGWAIHALGVALFKTYDELKRTKGKA